MPVKRNPADFQVEQVLKALERASQQFPPDSEENASIELAAYALGFIDQQGHLDAFRRYLADAKRPAAEVIAVEHEFTDMPEAQRWLNAQPPPKRGTLVKVAGRTHTVWTKDGDLLLLPSFTPQEAEALAAEDEE